MSEDRKPQKGDRARWTCVIEGTVEDVFPKAIHLTDSEGDLRVLATHIATVEVLEPADDPSKSLVGEVREALDGSPAAKLSENVWWVFGWPVDAESRLLDSDVRGCKVIGSVPGTPAAEAQQAEERQGRAHDDAFFRYGSNLRSDGSSVLSFHKVGGNVHIRIRHHGDEPLRYHVAVVQEEDIVSVADALADAREVIDAKTLFPPPVGTATPPLSEYSQHLAHRASPVDGCEYCPPPGQVLP